MRAKRYFNTGRLRRLRVLTLIVGVLIAWRLVDIQLVSHARYTAAAEQNRTQTIYQTAPRGRILTAGDIVLAGNEPAFSLYFMPAAQGAGQNLPGLAADIGEYMDMPVEGILKQLNSAVKSGKAVAIAENVSPSKIFAAAELQVYHGGLYVLEGTKRSYPNGAFAAHLLGYMGPMDSKTWRARSPGSDYRLSSKLGKSGIEKHFEADLKGRDGGTILEVDHLGRVRRIIEANAPQRGSDIYTTLNHSVQKAAEDALQRTITGRGAVVALDPRTGAVLALVSAPDYDPGIFSPYSGQEAKRVNIPEYNLAIQGMYPPASPFKIITAIAAAQAGRLDLKEKVNCEGKIVLNGRTFKCWSVHGPVDFMEGMAQSCDVYFYQLGLKTGAAKIEKAQRMFRLGRQTGIDLPFEKSGNTYGPSKRARRKTYWFGGDTLNLSIGQGELLVTPIQMAVFISAIANKGDIWRPYYIERVVNTQGKTTFSAQKERVSRVELKPGVYDLIHSSLRGVVDYATGRAARVGGIEVYGKTGTGQTPHGDDHAWFVAFTALPGQEPDFAVSVLVEHGRSGAAAAAPVAREVIKAYYGVE